jgi:hypothetical protein
MDFTHHNSKECVIMKKFVRITTAILALALSTSLFGCKKKKPEAPTGTPVVIPAVTAPALPHVSDAINSLLHGNQVSFGTYEQDGDTSNGKEPIEWVVSETWVSNNKYIVMLLSKKALLVSQYNEKLDDVTWQSCSLRKYLNNDFQQFSFCCIGNRFYKTAWNYPWRSYRSGASDNSLHSDEAFSCSYDHKRGASAYSFCYYGEEVRTVHSGQFHSLSFRDVHH